MPRLAALPRRPVHVFAAATLIAAACNHEVQNASSFDPTNATTGDSDPTTADTTTTAPDTSSSTAEPTESSSSSTVAPETSTGMQGDLCGDGMITGNEECDCGGEECTSEGLDGMACTDLGNKKIAGILTGGVLTCDPASCEFDVSMCTYCGDGEILDAEECEPDLEIPTSCAELGRGTLGELDCTDDCVIVTTDCSDCGYEIRFDEPECEDGFVASAVAGNANTWECGDPTAYQPGPGVAKTGVFATNLSGPYAANETSAITSAALDLTGCDGRTVEMTIHHYHSFEGGVINSDGGLVQVSEDGDNWTTITPTGGSLYSANALNASSPLVDGEPGFSGNVDDNEWVDSTFDLTQFVGSDTLQVRFLFGSDGSNQQGGWYIDAIDIVGSG